MRLVLLVVLSVCINCTVVELKQNIDKYVVIDTSTVLIVPLWN